MAKTIMLIDDSTTLRRMLAITLRSDGYEIIEASNGVEALELAEESEFDLIICDLNMPRMGGIEFLKNIKKNARHKFKPVIMLTTEPEDSIKEDARELGVKIWKVKPFIPDDIKESVRKLIRP